MQSNKTLLATIIGGLLLCVSLQPIQAAPPTSALLRIHIETIIEGINHINKNEQHTEATDKLATDAITKYKKVNKALQNMSPATREEVGRELKKAFNAIREDNLSLANEAADQINNTIENTPKGLLRDMQASIDKAITAVKNNPRLQANDRDKLLKVLKDYKDSPQSKRLAIEGTVEDKSSFESMIKGVTKRITKAKGTTIARTIAEKFYETLSKFPDSFGGKAGKAGLERLTRSDATEILNEHHGHRTQSLQEHREPDDVVNRTNAFGEIHRNPPIGSQMHED